MLTYVESFGGRCPPLANGDTEMGFKLFSLGVIAWGFMNLWGAWRDFRSRVAEGSDGLGQPFRRPRSERPVSYWATLLWYCIAGPLFIIMGIYGLFFYE